MATCFNVADFFIANTDQDDDITSLKLQKLCSYAHAFSLVLLGKPLFSNLLEAFTHGPVIRELYEAYRVLGREPLSTSLSLRDVRIPFTNEELFVLETVNNYYGAYSASRLRNMSHEDFPGDFGSQNVIPNDEIQKRFESNPIIKAIQEAY